MTNVMNKIGDFYRDHKGKIIIAAGVIGAIVVSGLLSKSNSEEVVENYENKEYEDTDFGRNCLITYSVEETGETLWKGRCSESYVEDMKNMEMDFKEIRQLNGIED